MKGDNKIAAAARAAQARVESRGAVVPAARQVPAKTADGRLALRELFDPMRQAVFLKELRAEPIVGKAARAAGITVATAYAMRKRSEDFAAQWDEALVEGVDGIEEELIRRGKAGSDRLLIEAARAHRPDKYSPKVDVAVQGAVEIVVDLVPGRFIPTGTEGPVDDVEDAEYEELGCEASSATSTDDRNEQTEQ
jgi:hypothetical protein